MFFFAFNPLSLTSLMRIEIIVNGKDALKESILFSAHFL
jgi:hypothetical protein